MKRHIRPENMKKTQGFHQDLYGYDLFYTVRNYMSASVV